MFFKCIDNFINQKGRKRIFGKISVMLIFLSAGWKGMSVSVWLTAAGSLPQCQCYIMGNERQREQTCAVAHMSLADSMLLVVLKSEDPPASNQTKVTFVVKFTFV